MSVNATVANRITDLIGSTYSTIPSNSYKDLINAAFNEIADNMKTELLLKYSKTPGRLEGETEWLVEDRKILKVTRVDAYSNGVERDCKYLDVIEYSRAKDSSSLYYATAHSPVYTFNDKNDGAATLTIFPTCNDGGQEGRIWYFTYALATTDLTGITTESLNTSHYMPSDCMNALVYKSCYNILTAYLSDQIQDEEDSELVNMVSAQIQTFDKLYREEMTRFMDGQPEGKAE